MTLRRVAAVLRRLKLPPKWLALIPDLSDVAALCGVVAIAYGASFIHPSLPPILIGLACLRLANWGR